MVELFIKGGPFMWPLLFALIVGIAMAFVKFWALTKASINTRKFLAKIKGALSTGGIGAATWICVNTRGPVASIFHAGLLRAGRGVEYVEKAIESAATIEMAFLERGMVWLATVANIAPMLGFLGTVSGMINAFAAIAAANDISPSVVAGGISEALLTTLFAQAILDMRLQRLTGLQRKKIEDEYKEVIKLIATLKSILESRAKVLAIIREDITAAAEAYGSERRTEIVDATTDFAIEDLIAEEDMAISISHTGYIKRLPVGTYRRQRRGGKGITGMGTKEDDFVEHMLIASTHDYILFFTPKGHCHWLRVHEIPQAGRAAKGKAIVNLLQVNKDDSVATFITARDFDDEHFVVMATRKGVVKKTRLSAYSHPRRGGIRAINIDKGDELIDAAVTDGNHDVVLAKRLGKAIRFRESDVREMGRTARGVRGTLLEKGDEVVGMVVAVGEQGTVLSVTENGYGKRTNISDYRIIKRGGKGVISIKANKRNGKVVAVRIVNEPDEVMIMTSKGVMIRLPVKGISVIGRNTQGVRIIKLDKGDRVIDIACVASEE